MVKIPGRSRTSQKKLLMYLAWHLPRDGHEIITAYYRHTLHEKLQQWSRQHGINFKFKRVKYTCRLCFDNDSWYNFFMLTWDPQDDTWFKEFTVIEPMKN